MIVAFNRLTNIYYYYHSLYVTTTTTTTISVVNRYKVVRGKRSQKHFYIFKMYITNETATAWTPVLNDEHREVCGRI